MCDFTCLSHISQNHLYCTLLNYTQNAMLILSQDTQEKIVQEHAIVVAAIGAWKAGPSSPRVIQNRPNLRRVVALVAPGRPILESNKPRLSCQLLGQI